ncbi:MAG: GTPase ObgE [Chloroflexi bacterium]|nr:GTPase ObgE [Chloroflexota bacterium]
MSPDRTTERGFFDEASIYVRAGSGGDGVSHFRREKYVPRGGPDGGDGGRGGDVVLRARSNLHALTAFRYKRRFIAANGGRGEGKKRHGANGEGVTVDVPCGTVAYDDRTGAVLADLVEEGQTVVVAEGGRGGLGNVHFKSARFQTPELATRGGGGQERQVRLELELLADIGLVGAPNAGKSSLLARLSAARPKVAPYPFTTLEPVLGVVQAGDSGVVFADLPGLIEGASGGAGLGMAFLRHVRRARVLVHVVDGSGLEGDPFEAFQAIDAELGAFSEDLLERPRIVAFNKMDLLEARELWPDFEALVLAEGYEAVAVSAASGTGLRELVGRTVGVLAEAPPAPRPEPEETAVLRPSPVDEPAQLFRRSDGAYVVRDARLEGLARKLNFDTPDAADYFQRQLDRRGVTERLERAGTTAGDTVVVGELEFEWMAPGL